jgi:hypothetical protein
LIVSLEDQRNSTKGIEKDEKSLARHATPKLGTHCEGS